MSVDLIDLDYENEKDKALTKQFMDSNNVKKYILGINKLTRSVQKHIDVDGIIDDFTRVHTSRKKSILQIDEVPKDSIILSTATGSPLEVKIKLDEMGYTHFNYLSFFKYSKLPLAEPPFILDFEENFKQNKDEYAKTYELLADDKSKEIFNKVMNFKISFDLDFMQGFTNNHDEQYFDKELIGDIKNICFVDGGGYIGDTAREVIKNFPDFKKLYLIEPLHDNMRLAQRELGEYENIEFIPLGLSNHKATLSFNDEKSFSTMYGTGTQSVEVDTLDNMIEDQVDFIKLDIEGAEQDAIEGARNTIKKYTPILAICIYHKAEDWYKVPQKVLEINPNYNVYLRHYMEGIFESVMYFIPKKSSF